MADWNKEFPGQRFTRLWHQTPGKRNAIYPWVITQDANGATVKLDDEQMKKLINAVLDFYGDDYKEKNA